MVKKHKKVSLESRRLKTGLFFTMPFTVGMIFFLIIPIVKSLVFSFSKLSVSATGFSLGFIGLENYKYAFMIDPMFRVHVLNSVKNMLINVPIVIIFSFFLASILNQKFHGRSLARAILFLPVIIASSVVLKIDSTDIMSGVISSGTQFEGAQNAGATLTSSVIGYLQQINLSPQITSFIISTVDRVYEITIMSAIPVIIFLAGLQALSPSLFEAAYIEGATKWEVFWKISFPMVSSLILVSVVYCIIDSFTNVTNIVISRIHSSAFNELNFGLSSAMAWSYMLIIFIVLGIVFKMLSKKIFYYN